MGRGKLFKRYSFITHQRQMMKRNTQLHITIKQLASSFRKMEELVCQRPYHVEKTGSRTITEISQHWA